MYKGTDNSDSHLASTMTACQLTRKDAAMIYHTVYRPSIEYTLGQSFLTSSQLLQIQRSVSPIIANCGYNRHTSRNIIFGPSRLGGGGFAPPIAAAGTAQIQHFLKHWRTPEEDVGKLIRIVIAWSQFYSGVSYSILECPTRPLPHLVGKFTISVRNYLSLIGGQI